MYAMESVPLVSNGIQSSKQATPCSIQNPFECTYVVVQIATLLYVQRTDMCTFGCGNNGKLGHGYREQRSSPVLECAGLGRQTRHTDTVRLGAYNGFDVKWICVNMGGNTNGQLSYGRTTLNRFSVPCLVEGMCDRNVIQISTHSSHRAISRSSPSSIRLSQEAAFNRKEHSDVVSMVENETVFGNVDVLSEK